MEQPFEVGPAGRRIRGVLALPEGGGRSPCVILSHGLISSKESAKYAALSEAFRAAGIAACRFDYAGCGESDGRIEETTLSGRVGSLDAVFERALSHPSVDAGRVGLLGSSFGGCTSLVKAANDKRVRCVSLWATPHTIEKKEETVSEVEFSDALYTDFARYDLLAEAEKVSYAFVVHGDRDEVVPYGEGKAIYRHLQKPKKFELIKGGDHILSAPSRRARAISLSLDWFRRFLHP